MEESIKGILEAIECYIDGARKSDRSIVAKAFADDATISWSENGELRIVPIEALYDYGDSLGPQEVAYSLTECSATEDTAIVRIESDFSKAGKFTDMFTMIKIGDRWEIVSKIYHIKKKNEE